MPVYLLPIVGADLILGSAWLATLGLHLADYASSTIKFLLQGKFITLQGDKDLQPSQAHLNQLKRMQSIDAISEFTIQILPQTIPADELLELPTDMEPKMATLLHTYRTVFSNPTDLPPNRTHNHAFSLHEGEKVKLRPYRYPHSQKEQIEVMVQEMLDQRIIQPSTSPFSSPIVLVKRKDGTGVFPQITGLSML